MVAERLMQATGGNPLALAELASTLDPDALSGAVPLPDPLPLARGVEALFLDRVTALPERTRALLLLAALEPAADLGLLARTGAPFGAGVDDLEPAELAGLVRVESMRIVFGHPLVRSSVEGGATFAQRQRAHLALAEALPAADAERRAWHAAAAAIEPDEQLATELERLALRARERGANAAAQAALTRAAELTPATGTRGRRLVAAAEAAWHAGRPIEALALVDRAAVFIDEPRSRASAARLRGVITFRTGSLEDGHRLLMEAARETAEVDPKTAYLLIGEAAKAGGFAGNPVWIRAAGDAVDGFPEPDRRRQPPHPPCGRRHRQDHVRQPHGRHAGDSRGARRRPASRRPRADGVRHHRGLADGRRAADCSAALPGRASRPRANDDRGAPAHPPAAHGDRLRRRPFRQRRGNRGRRRAPGA